MKKTLLLAIFLLPTLAFATIDSNLKYGSRGVEVTELQEFLIDKGFLTGQPTGNFFALTKKAVIAYQKSVNLPATGFVGQLTRAEINKELEVNNEAEIQETGVVNQPVSNNVDDLLKKIADLTEQQKAQQEQTNRLIETIKEPKVGAISIPQPTYQSSFDVYYDNSSSRCSIKESGLLSCVGYLEIAHKLNDKEINENITITIPSLGIEKTVNTSFIDSTLKARFDIPFNQDGTFPMNISTSGGYNYTYNLVIDRINKEKASQCSAYKVFCNSDTAYSDITPKVLKISENAQLETDSLYPIIGEIGFTGITGSSVAKIIFETTDVALMIKSDSTFFASKIGVTDVIVNAPITPANKLIIKANTDWGPIKKGQHTLIVKGIEVYGNETREMKKITGLPITFTFEVK